MLPLAFHYKQHPIMHWFASLASLCLICRLHVGARMDAVAGAIGPPERADRGGRALAGSARVQWTDDQPRKEWSGEGCGFLWWMQLAPVWAFQGKQEEAVNNP